MAASILKQIQEIVDKKKKEMTGVKTLSRNELKDVMEKTRDNMKKLQKESLRDKIWSWIK